MQNYLQAEILNHNSKLEALQTKAGYSLLFFIDSNQQLQLVEEVQNKLSTLDIQNQFLQGLVDPIYEAGWRKQSLSKSGQKCTNFDVNQDVVSGTIILAKVISNGNTDELYISTDNSNKDLNWTKNVKWEKYAYDGTKSRSKIKIVNVFITETDDEQFITVDLIRDPNSAAKFVDRYWLDLKPASGPKWVERNLSIDLSIDGYKSCMGRVEEVDGTYTVGKIAGKVGIGSCA